jgi:hypothetical protein
MLKSHIDCGLSFPPSYFLKGVLRHYRLQLHHIAPNSFTALAGFIALCEGYLGISPRGDLFCLYFNICHNRDTNGDPRNCGSVSFVPWSGKSYPYCRGDDLGGMPGAKLLAGQRPRSLHGARIRRPAPPEWAGCASSWLTSPPRRAGAGHRRQDSSNGRISKGDRSPTRSTDAKDEVTPATTGLNQSAIEDPFARKDLREIRAYAPRMPDQRDKGAL